MGENDSKKRAGKNSDKKEKKDLKSLENKDGNPEKLKLSIWERVFLLIFIIIMLIPWVYQPAWLTEMVNEMDSWLYRMEAEPDERERMMNEDIAKLREQGIDPATGDYIDQGGHQTEEEETGTAHDVEKSEL